MASQYSTETKAEVLALVRQGEPADRAGAACGVPARTAQLWAKRFRQIAAEEGDREIIDEDYRLALRSSQLIHDAYDSIEEEGTAQKHLIALNAIRGTAIDKLLKRDAPRDTERRPFAIIVQIGEKADTPETIEGEARVIDD